MATARVDQIAREAESKKAAEGWRRVAIRLVFGA
jgi:hypothetical protein